MQVDVIGLENVVKYIEATKLSKFTIQRLGSNAQAIPVFECIESETNANAVNEFGKWAAVMNNAIPYKITLFDFAEIATTETGEKKISKSKSKTGKTEMTFILNSVYATPQATQQQQQQNGGFDLAALRAEIVNDIAKKQEENAILQELKALKDRFAELDAEEEEEEEEEKAGALGGIDANQVAQIMGLAQMFLNKNPQNPPTINGTKEEKTENLNKAIRILYKHDAELDTDLLKLADLAENKPDTFKMLLQTLRNM